MSVRYFTPDEVAESRGLDRKTVYRAIHTGRLHAENWGSRSRPRFLIPESALEALVYRPAGDDSDDPVMMARPLRVAGQFTRLAREPGVHDPGR